MSPRPLRARLAPIALASLVLGMASCASTRFERETETSGTYRSTSLAVTLFTIDMPADALQIARENASDSGLAAMVEVQASVTPDWGWWNWVLDIFSVRRAKVSGTWGFKQP